MKIKTSTVMGLFLSIFGYILVLALLNLPLISNRIPEHSQTIMGLLLIWLIVVILVLIIKYGEKRDFSSIGSKTIKGKEIILAIGLGIGLSLTVPLLTLAINQIMPSNGSGIEEVTSNSSAWMLFLSILTAGISEEIIFRGYILERFYEITKNYWIAMLVSLAAFVLPHTVSWDLNHVIAVVLPLGLVLTGIYLWKRNLVFNIIIHIVINLPLVGMALINR